MNVFPEFYLFSECNSSSIFANVVAYQFIPCELRPFDAPRKVAKAQCTYQQPSRGGVTPDICGHGAEFVNYVR